MRGGGGGGGGCGEICSRRVISSSSWSVAGSACMAACGGSGTPVTCTMRGGGERVGGGRG